MRQWLMGIAVMAGVMMGPARASDLPAWEKFGADIPEGRAIPVSAAVADVAAHAGQARKFSGRITDVCQKKGCWVMLEDNGRSARVLLGDHDFYVPKDVRGRAEVYGVLSQVTLPAAARAHARREGSAGADVPDVEYRIVAEGVQVLADDPGA